MLSSQNQTFITDTAKIGVSSGFSPPKILKVISLFSPQIVQPGSSLESNPQTDQNLEAGQRAPHTETSTEITAHIKTAAKSLKQVTDTDLGLSVTDGPPTRTPILCTLDDPTIPVTSIG